MFQIKTRQLKIFEAASAETFPERVLALLRESFPEREGELRGPDAIARAIARAREIGMEGERDICKFVALVFVLGGGVEAEPWAAAVLGDARLAGPTARVNALFAAAKDRQLEAETAALAAGMKG